MIQVRVFRLSEKRGVTELWNAIDESVNWEEEVGRIKRAGEVLS